MKFCILGSDLRFAYMREQMEKEHHTLCGVDRIGDCDVVVFPLPTSRDGEHVNCEEQYLLVDIIPKIPKHALVLVGGLSNAVSLMFYLQSIHPIDYASVEAFAVRNAHATAEAALSLAMKQSDSTLLGQRCLVVGFGRIGKFLAHQLRSLGADVTATARKEADLAWIECLGYHAEKTQDLADLLPSHPIVFNTVPGPIVPVSAIGENTILIELATSPMDYYMPAVQRGATILCAKGLPPQYAPKTAKQLLYQTVQTIITEELI